MNTITKTIRNGLIAASVALIAATTASATAIQLANVDRVTGYYSGSGGEIRVTPATTDAYLQNVMAVHYTPASLISGRKTGFETFCLESQVPLGTAPYFYTISDKALTQNDPISLGTAYLYYLFVKGNLGSYDYTPGAGRAASAGLLQKAIWWLEGEANGAQNVFTAAAVAKFGVNVKSNSNGAYGVKVLNLWGDANASKNKQDLLVLVPDGGATVALLGFAVIALAAIRRKFAA